MISTPLTNISIFTFITALCIYAHRRVALINPVIGFLIFNWIIGSGVIVYANYDVSSDVVYVIITLMSPILVTIGSWLILLTRPIVLRYQTFWSKPIIRDGKSIQRRAIVLTAVSISVTVLYYQAIGYNILQMMLTGGGEDLTTMRLNAYSGEKYFAPGYVNQFKNTLLPVFYIYFYIRLRAYKLQSILFLVAGGVFLIFALSGAGQRTFIIMAALMIIFTIIAYTKKFVSVRVYVMLGSVVFLLFGYMSLGLGRSLDFGFFSSVDEILHRVFESNQLSALVGFNYVYNTVGVQHGLAWGRDMLGMLPGFRGDSIANEIYYIIYGSYRGTSPLGVWGSMYYNFGWMGIIICGIIWGAAMQGSYLMLLSGRKTQLRLVSYAALFMYFSTWASGGPVQLINNGALTMVLLLFLMRIRWGENVSKWKVEGAWSKS